MKIQIILGSTRDVRAGEKVAKWFYSVASKTKGVEFELIDLRDYPLPLFNEPMSPSTSGGKYVNPDAKRWADKIGESDGYVVVTPEYNHGYPAVLKNALDYVYKQWNNKPVAFVGYGAISGGIRSVEQLRLVAIELQMVPIRNAIYIPFIWEAFGEDGKPLKHPSDESVTELLDQLLWWATALKKARTENS